jgi:hypothetical protein
MKGFCDCCDERAEQLFDITRVRDLIEIARTYQYRHVCQSCYDDLYKELELSQETAAEDET